MALSLKRQSYINSRVETNWQALQSDIQAWQTGLVHKEGGIILHHLQQFKDFCEQAHNCLWAEAQTFPGWLAADDKIGYRALVIGALTSQWVLFRQVLSQRLADSPYKDQLSEFDRAAHIYYYRLYEALPDSVQSHPSLSSPIIYLGRLAELTFFNPQAPGLLSVPFGAIYGDKRSLFEDNRSLLAIPHEVGHAIFERIPGLIPELQSRVFNFLADQKPVPTRKEAMLRKVIVNWMGEIVADLAGTALVGPKFGQSALEISTAPDDMVGVTDQEHPVSLIRPYIHLATLQYLSRRDPELQKQYKAGINNLTQYIEDVTGHYLERRFESIPALTIIPLEKVKIELEKIVERIFQQDLVTLANQSLGDVLLACANKSETQIVNKSPRALPWGQVEELCNDGQFVLDISEANQPEYATPGNFHLKFCCDRGWWICC